MKMLMKMKSTTRKEMTNQKKTMKKEKMLMKKMLTRLPGFSSSTSSMCGIMHRSKP